MRDYLSVSTNPVHVEFFNQIREAPKVEQIRWLLRGMKTASFEVLPLNSHCFGWIEWTRHGAELIRFEELLSGAAMRSLAAFLSLGEAIVSAAISGAVGATSRTLNGGRAERWKEELDESVLKEIHDECSTIIESLGYRAD